jgi:hypothetical protein
MTRITANALILFLTLAAVAGAGASRANPLNTVAFVDVTTVPMSRNELRLHQTVLIEGDRIVAIGSTDSIRIPQRAKRIPGGGRFLMPGLIDCMFIFSVVRQTRTRRIGDSRISAIEMRTLDCCLSLTV